MKVFIYVMFFLAGTVQAENTIESYSHRELLNMANAYVAVTKFAATKSNKSNDVNIDTLLKAAEFKGYVSSYLDFSQEGDTATIVRSCISRQTVEQIAVNVADVLINAKPDRQIGPRDRFEIALLSYCMVSGETKKSPN